MLFVGDSEALVNWEQGYRTSCVNMEKTVHVSCYFSGATMNDACVMSWLYTVDQNLSATAYM
jgi:hypothetical protein